MARLKLLILGAASALIGTIAGAGDGGMIVTDAYARASSPIAKAGAAFLVITNHSDEDDRLIGVETPAAKRAELHTHIMSDGVMQMRHDEDGFDLPAGQSHVLQRGGDHVMMMGLNMPFLQGTIVPMTLIFENADPITIDIVVDLERE